MVSLKPFYDVANDPFGYARRWKNKHESKIIGHFCSYTPEEIIFAGGALPFRIFSTSANPFLSDTHLQTYCCNLVRSVLNDALSGKLDFLDGAVFPHTCDSIQRLSDVWRMNMKFGFHADVLLPVKLKTDSAGEYMIGVLRKFKRDFENWLGAEISDRKLEGAVDTYNRLRTYIKEIYRLRTRHPGKIFSRDLHAIVKASMVMDKTEFIETMPGVIDMLTNRESEKNPNMKRLVLTGGICNMPDIYDIIENAGAVVVWDDFCTGSRYIEGSIEMSGDTVEAIANRYLDRIICPAKHAGLLARGEQIVNIARENKAEGVIFLLLKFCDPHAFDYPYIKSLLGKEGIPSLLIEIEGQQTSGEQLKTRCEAFVETL